MVLGIERDRPRARAEHGRAASFAGCQTAADAGGDQAKERRRKGHELEEPQTQEGRERPERHVGRRSPPPPERRRGSASVNARPRGRERDQELGARPDASEGPGRDHGQDDEHGEGRAADA